MRIVIACKAEPMSFFNFIGPIQASPLAVLSLSCAQNPGFIQDPPSADLSGGPKEIFGGHLTADPGLQYGTALSNPTMQIKKPWMYAAPLW